MSESGTGKSSMLIIVVDGRASRWASVELGAVQRSPADSVVMGL